MVVLCILTLRDLWLVLRSVDNNQRLNAEWCLLMPMQFRCLLGWRMHMYEPKKPQAFLKQLNCTFKFNAYTNKLSCLSDRQTGNPLLCTAAGTLSSALLGTWITAWSRFWVVWPPGAEDSASCTAAVQDVKSWSPSGCGTRSSLH